MSWKSKADEDGVVSHPLTQYRLLASDMPPSTLRRRRFANNNRDVRNAIDDDDDGTSARRKFSNCCLRDVERDSLGTGCTSSPPDSPGPDGPEPDDVLLSNVLRSDSPPARLPLLMCLNSDNTSQQSELVVDDERFRCVRRRATDSSASSSSSSPTSSPTSSAPMRLCQRLIKWIHSKRRTQRRHHSYPKENTAKLLPSTKESAKSMEETSTTDLSILLRKRIGEDTSTTVVGNKTRHQRSSTAESGYHSAAPSPSSDKESRLTPTMLTEKFVSSQPKTLASYTGSSVEDHEDHEEGKTFLCATWPPLAESRPVEQPLENVCSTSSSTATTPSPLSPFIDPSSPLLRAPPSANSQTSSSTSSTLVLSSSRSGSSSGTGSCASSGNNGGSGLLEEWAIPWSDLRFGEAISRGRFGSIYRGLWHGEVVIHTFHLRDMRSKAQATRNSEMDTVTDDLKAFLAQVRALASVRHDNLALFMGASLDCDDSNVDIELNGLRKCIRGAAVVTGAHRGPSLYHLLRDPRGAHLDCRAAWESMDTTTSLNNPEGQTSAGGYKRGCRSVSVTTPSIPIHGSNGSISPPLLPFLLPPPPPPPPVSHNHHHHHSSHRHQHHLPLTARLHIARQVAQAMGYLHARGLLHRTLNTRNIFVEARVKLCLLDHGMADPKWDRTGCSALPRAQLPYWSPELMRSLHLTPPLAQPTAPYSKESDVYAFGTVLYELLAECSPFRGLPSHVVIWQIGSGRHQPLERLNAAPALKTLVSSCWRADPATRPSFAQLVGHLVQPGGGPLPRRHSCSEPSRLHRTGLPRVSA